MMGGFFGLERTESYALPYSESACCAYLSSGRAALEILLLSMPGVGGLRRALVPRFCCDTVLQPFHRLGIAVERYAVSDNLRPLPPGNAGADDLLLLVNYFGLTGEFVDEAAARHPGPVIVDATLALYSAKAPGVPAFYSLRKFGGVADGGIACAPYPLELPEETDCSAQRAGCLLQRTESGAEAALEASERAENSLQAPARRMSPLTRYMASGINWHRAARTRCRNYEILQRSLGCINRLPLPQQAPCAPFCYPLVTGIPDLRDSLIEAGVALPLFWPEVVENTTPADTENRLARTLLPLPLDQRYTACDMKDLCRLIDPRL